MNTRDLTQAIEKAVQKSAALIQRDLQSTTKTWKRKPKFTVTVDQSGGNYSVVAGTDDAIYGYIDGGTGKYGPKGRAYVIRPKKRGGILRFRKGFGAKTRPGIIGSTAGVVAGGDWVSKRQVIHPGIKARKFTTTIQKRRQVTVQQEISQSIAKALRKQGQ